MNFVSEFYFPSKLTTNSTDAVPIAEEYIIPPLMDGWDDDGVEKL